MTVHTGMLLVATPALVDPNFARSVVFLIQHDEDGAVGVVLNRPSVEEVSEHLPDVAGSVVEPGVVFVGGPVEPVVAIGLERTDVPVRPIEPMAGVGLLDLADGGARVQPCRIYAGYSGWGPGQLESEIAEGSWIVVEATIADVFTDDPEGLWGAVLRRQPGRVAMLASHPMDPTLN